MNVMMLLVSGSLPISIERLVGAAIVVTSFISASRSYDGVKRMRRRCEMLNSMGTELIGDKVRAGAESSGLRHPS